MNKRTLLSTVAAIALSVFSLSLHAQPKAGQIVKGLTCTGTHYEVGTEVPYSYYVTPGAVKEGNAVYVILELMSPERLKDLADRLTEQKVIPQGIFLYVNWGTLKATNADGKDRCMRGEEFDQNGIEFTNFLIADLIPQAAAHAGIEISNDPNLHFISGGSSGGMAGWNAVWYRNDFFRRGYLASPTFSAMRGGEEIMTLVRKTEPRPIRVYITAGTVEPDYFFGSSFLVPCDAATALRYAGYDFKFDVFANGEHGYNCDKPEMWEKVLRWLYAEKEVTAPRRSVRFRKLIPEGSVWEETTATLPAPATQLTNSHGTYTVKKGSLYFKPNKGKKVKVEGLNNVTAIAFSSDMWRLYATDLSRRFVYAYTLDKNGVPGYMYQLAPFHLPHDCTVLGANDMCVSTGDRVFMATELGVQSCCTFGLSDYILPLPGDVPAVRVWLDGGYLYAASADKVYRRAVLSEPHNGKDSHKPAGEGYGDGFDYSRANFKDVFEKYPKGTPLEF